MLTSPVFLYPQKRSFALSNLAVHWFFNAFSDIFPDLIVSDSKAGIFNGTKLTDRPVVFVSLSYAPDMINFAQIMKESGVPLLKRDRDRGLFPIFICGGIAATLNPEPLTQIFDAVFIGEGECMEEDIRKLLSFNAREELLNYFNVLPYCVTSQKSGAFPTRTESCEFFVCSNPLLHKMGNDFNNRVIIELNRGCSLKCKFCAASYAYKNFRETNCNKVSDFIEKPFVIKDGLALMGTSLANVSCFDLVLEKASFYNISLSLSSIRISDITEKRVEILKKCGVKSVSVAIESGCYETRKAVLKSVKDDTIFDALKILRNFGIKTKIYFIAGLPGTDPVEEAEGVATLLRSVKDKKALGEVSLSVTPFSPKPLTPYARFEMMEKKEYKKYIHTLKKKVAEISKGIKIDFFPYKESKLDETFGKAKGEDFIKLIARGSL